MLGHWCTPIVLMTSFFLLHSFISDPTSHYYNLSLQWVLTPWCLVSERYLDLFCLECWLTVSNWLVSHSYYSLINWLKVKVTLRMAVVQSVSKSWCRSPPGGHDQIFITVWRLRFFCGAPSLTRGRVCLLYTRMLLTLVGAVFLGSESLGTRGRILLSQIWDFPFRRLLRLAQHIKSPQSLIKY
jgi:hypothetical protein